MQKSLTNEITESDSGVKHPGALLLDSKLITPTISDGYNIKLVDCGDYVQVYCYEKKKKKRKNDDDDLNLIKNFNVGESEKERKEKNAVNVENVIEVRNIIRSKLQCQRLAKANAKDWETFITLTFAENEQNIESANRKFRYFVDKVRRVKKDFKYLCIPEFQKRGAIHYHLLTNVSTSDDKLIYSQSDNPKYKHIKYWNLGFDSIEVIKGDIKKIVGYISKYMTKEIDNRLFGHRRYFYSNNLDKPLENYIDTDIVRDFNFYQKKIQELQPIYQRDYINPYDNSKVTFLEYQKITP